MNALAKTLFVVMALNLSYNAFAFEDLEECRSEGGKAGWNNAKMFCSISASLTESTPVRAQRFVSTQICELHYASACTGGMQDYLNHDQACAQKIRRDREESDKWRLALTSGCPQPKMVNCPFRNARVHKNIWCYNPASGQYYGNIRDTWWRFVRKEVEGDEEFYWVDFKSNVGSAMSRMSAAEFTLVRP